MNLSVSPSGLTVGQLLLRLRMNYNGVSSDLYKAICVSSATYLKIERDERELSFLMALRICAFYKLDLHEFISMLSDQELVRQDVSSIRAQEKREKRRAASEAKVIDISTQTGHGTLQK